MTGACIDVKDRAPNVRFSEVEAAGGVENTDVPNPEATGILGDSLLYVDTEECTACTASYQPDVCPVGAIHPEERSPDGAGNTTCNSADPNKGHDHSVFIQQTRDVFAA